MQKYDLIIVGAGVVGLAAAAALATTDLKILILDQKPLATIPISDTYDARVFAINHSSQELLNNINAWPEIKAQRLCPYTAMHVWDPITRAEINFSHREIGQQNLGFIIEQQVIINSLIKIIKTYNNIKFVTAKLEALTLEPAIITTTTQEKFSAQLIIAADGANSWCRQQVGIACREQPYQQQAIVATVQTAHPHKFTARQSFLPTGPLAFLPLADPNLCSIVWSLDDAASAEILALPDHEFKQLLATKFDRCLGDVLQVSSRQSFPLIARHAQEYVKNNLVLIGDAAHTIHPLAGQGVNLGLADVSLLVRNIKNSLNKNRDYAALHNLRPFVRARKMHNMAMLAAMQGFKKLFAQQNSAALMSRKHGLQLVAKSKILKRLFLNAAVQPLDNAFLS